MSWRLAGWLGLCLTLAGCAALPQRPVAPAALPANGDWRARRAALLAIQAFSIHGRVAVAAGEEGFSATLRWTQRGPRGQMQLQGPLGVGALRVEFSDTELRVTNARGQQLANAAARDELERRLGFALPLRELSYWVRGVAAPPAADMNAAGVDAAGVAESLDASGLRLGALQQADWRVEYAAYAASLLGMLPQKLTVRRDGYRIRLAIDRWSVP